MLLPLTTENLENELTKAGYLYASKDVRKYVKDLTALIKKEQEKVIYYSLFFSDGKILTNVLRKFGFKVETITYLDRGIKNVAYQVTAM